MLPAVRLLVITRQFRTPHWFPCEMTSEKPQQTTSEIPYCWRQWRVATKIWVVLLIGWNKFLSRHDQSEELPRSVTRHQYGIAALVFQTSFRGQTSGGVLKCRLFSQATQRHVVSWALGKKNLQFIFAWVVVLWSSIVVESGSMSVLFILFTPFLSGHLTRRCHSSVSVRFRWARRRWTYDSS